MALTYAGVPEDIQYPNISGSGDERQRQQDWEHAVFRVAEAGKDTAIINDVKYEVNFGVPILAPMAVATAFDQMGAQVVLIKAGLNNKGEPYGDATDDAPGNAPRRTRRSRNANAGDASGDADAPATGTEAEAGAEAEANEAGTEASTQEGED